MTNELEIAKRALKSADACVWDKHYGNGLSAEYARAVHAEISEGLAAVERLETRCAELEAAVLNSSGDNLCWLTEATGGGTVKIPPRDEFLESCRRFHAQIAGDAGELVGCKTIAQLESEIVRLEAERQSDTARLISWLRVNMRVRADELGNSASRQEGETFYRMAGGSCLLENVANGLHLWAESMPADYDATKEHAAIDAAIKSPKESANV